MTPQTEAIAAVRTAKRQRTAKSRAPLKITSQSQLNAHVKSTCDILRRSNCAGAMQYVPELSWILFLRILDERETLEAQEAAVLDTSFTPSLASPYRWQDWGATPSPTELTDDGKMLGWKRQELQGGSMNAFFAFVNAELLPHLKKLHKAPNATPRQKIIAEILSGVERTRVDAERNFADVLDKVHPIRLGDIDDQHIFAVSQVYEGLLLKMGEKGNDGGQFFTPREVIRAMVRAVNPTVGDKVYDPCCGTGGFLAQAHDWMHAALDDDPAATAEQYETLSHSTFYGREKENLVYPIALANLVLHGIDEPHLWHGNTLTGGEVYGGLYRGAPAQFEVILTNPPFGGKEGAAAQTSFTYKTSATQVLFLQHVLNSLARGGRAAVVVDEGVLFRTNENAFVKVKQNLLDTCDLWGIVSLPSGAFANAGAGVKTNILFFDKGKRTEKVWYYDLSHVKMGKKSPLTLAHFEEFFELLPTHGHSENAWTVTRKEIEAKGYDLKAVNPNRKGEEDTRTVIELLELADAYGAQVREALAGLRV